MRRIHRCEVRMVRHFLDIGVFDGDCVPGHGVFGSRDTL